MTRYPILLLAMLLAFTELAGFGRFAPVSGRNREPGHVNSPGDEALFNDPMGLARDSDGNLYVCDARNHVIRKIASDGTVTTIAGSPGAHGAVDGSASEARFAFPTDITIAPDGALYVADSGNHCIRRIDTSGVVTTLAGQLGNANDITQDLGSTYTIVAKAIDGQGASARFNSPAGITCSTEGLLYVSDTGHHIIRKIDLSGNVTTLAGKAGAWGSADGAGAQARFNSPHGLCIGNDGGIYVADAHNHAIRRITTEGLVTTFSGNARESGCATGNRLDARYCMPTDIDTHPHGGFIICEAFNHALFRLGADGNVHLFAGNTQTTTPPAPHGLFNPTSVACDAQGNAYVADTFNQQVRLVIANFRTTIAELDGAPQLSFTWDSIPGRDYHLQTLRDGNWTNLFENPARATADTTTLTIQSPNTDSSLYRILLVGF